VKQKWLLTAVFICLSLGQLKGQSILFDFDAAPVHVSLPIDLIAEGVTAHLSADPVYYNYSIQPANALGFTPAGFAGNCIYPNTIYKCDLLVSFDRALTDVFILYAPQELAIDTSCTMRITAYYGSKFVATNTHVLNPDGNTAWPSDVLSITAAEPFTRVVIHYDTPPPNTQENYGVIFVADNLLVTPWSAPYARIDSLITTLAGHTLITGVTVPFGMVTITATQNLSQQFDYLASTIAGGDGSFQFEDIYAPLFNERFYRVTYP